MRRIRLLLVELQPPPLDRAGIVATLTSYLEEVRPAADVRITSHLAPEPPRETAVIAYRLAQQGLVHALRQAGASEVEVLFRGLDRGVYLRIADDGAGLAEHAPGAGPRELALAEMRERAELAGGWSHVLSAPGAGTIVECWIPLAPGGAMRGAERPGTADLRPSTLDPRKG
jgi:signal transduction histidine kinase